MITTLPTLTPVRNTQPLKRPVAAATPSVQFGYGPTTQELTEIRQTLKGQPVNGALTPSYLPTAETVEGLTNLLAGNPVNKATLSETLAQGKARVLNHHLFLLGKPLTQATALQPEAQRFLDQLDSKVNQVLSRTLTNGNGFNDAAREVFKRYVALTAPVLFTMGFADAVDHAGDVARLATRQAIQLGGTPVERLQAALVGWLHDPKLRADFSWSNLATHPAVASALAQTVFEDAQLTQRVSAYLQTTQSPRTAQQFGDGVSEALAINNDSEFVLKNVILGNPFNHPLGEPGLAPALTQDTRQVILQRFFAPSKNQPVPTLTPDQEAALDQASLATDLRTIEPNALREALELPADQALEPTFQDLLEGKNQDAQKLAAARTRLMNTPQAIQSPRVKGTSLLAHHADVKEAPVAAMSLSIADPLLLSPHKIVEAGTQPTPMGRLKSFLGSIEDNINALPQQAQANGRKWLGDLYSGMLQAAQQLTGKPAVAAIGQEEDTVKVKRQLLEQPDTWTALTENVDYSNLNAKDPEQQPAWARLTTALKTAYQQAAERSPFLLGEAPSSTQPSTLAS
jgi:hypothetical protein